SGNLQKSAGGAVYKMEYCEPYEGVSVSMTVDGAVRWRAEIHNICLQDFIPAGSSVIVFGRSYITASFDTQCGRIAMIDQNGTVLWDKTPANGFHWESYDAAVCDDESIAVFGFGDFDTLCFTRFDYDGNITAFTTTPLEQYGYLSAIDLDDGYLVKTINYDPYHTLFIKFDKNGAITDSFSFSDQQDDYYFTDMTTQSGKILFSGYRVPKPKSDYGGREEIGDILDIIFNQREWEIENKELTALLKANYTAVLLICDGESSLPERCYAVKESLGGVFSRDINSRLLWDTEHFVSSLFSPATSSYTLAGECRVYRYAFNENADRLAEQAKTDETTWYRR
ncbi:MAG: hypothetical protein FWE80_09890, partial [Oscillospiraceae bacterium]|nr:hypothetical protein [Oscillospiraceae bacterium]